MILRKYLYIDVDFVNDIYASIVGYDYEDQKIEQASNKNSSGRAALGLPRLGLGVDGQIGSTVSGTSEFSAKNTPAAKLQYILDYLKTTDNIPYYSNMSMEIWQLLNRDSIFEGAFSLEFTKIEEYAQMAQYGKALSSILNNQSDKNNEVLDQIEKFGETEAVHGTPILLSFIDGGSIRCFSYLDEKYLRVNKSQLHGEAVVLCKVSRIINPKEKVELTTLKGLQQALKLNHDQKRKLGNTNSLNSYLDTIKGPAIEVLPIAIYK